MASKAGSVHAALLSLLGSSPVQSAEDMVVALGQAILLSSGFSFGDLKRAWNSPGLPQAHCAAKFTCDTQPGAITEVKWIALGSNVMMLAVSLAGPNPENASIHTIQITTHHVVRKDAEFPFVHSDDNDVEVFAADLRGLLTDDAIERLSSAVRSQLLPEAAKEGGSASAELRQAVDTQAQRAGRPSSEEIYRGEEWGQPSTHARGGPLSHGAPQHPANIGRDDLDPLGSAFGSGVGEGGGMVVGPGHPMFRRGVGGDSDDFDGPRPFGGPQTLPPGAVPPDARFDPIGPFGQMPGPPRPRGGGFPRAGPQSGSRGGGGGAGRLFSGEPDPDAEEPPNSSWNYYL